MLHERVMDTINQFDGVTAEMIKRFSTDREAVPTTYTHISINDIHETKTVLSGNHYSQYKIDTLKAVTAVMNMLNFYGYDIVTYHSNTCNKLKFIKGGKKSKSIFILYF